MHQCVYYIGDDVDDGLAKFEYTPGEYKLKPIAEIIKDPKYQAFLADHISTNDTDAFLYIRHRLKENGPVLVVDKECMSYVKDSVRDACIETIVMLNDKGQLCQVELLTDNPNGNKWDWWVVGGRWQGSLITKPDAFRYPTHPSETLRKNLNTYLQGTSLCQPEVEEFNPLSSIKHLESNSAKLSDIDFELAYKHWKGFYAGIYGLIRNCLIDKEKEEHKALSDFKERGREQWQSWSKQESVVTIRETLKDHPEYQWFWYDSELIDQAILGNKEFYETFAWSQVVPYSFVYDGKWYCKDDLFLKDENGNSLDWSDVEKRSEASRKWNEYFLDFMKSIPGDSRVTVVDIHY